MVVMVIRVVDVGEWHGVRVVAARPQRAVVVLSKGG